LKLKHSFRWSLWGFIIGMGSAWFLVILFPITHWPFIYQLFTSADWLAVHAAMALTSWFFPGDLIQRGVSIATFFDLILISATGVQCGIVGFVLGLLAAQRAARRAEK